MPTAIIRPVSPKMADCELTHLDRQPIDIEKAIEQHLHYEDALRLLGCEIIQVAAAPGLPDSMFVEDCAIVLPELAIITLPGAESRRPEIDGIKEALEPCRKIYSIQPPGVLDGGDVLVIGQKIWVGLSSRSNEEAIEQLRFFTKPYGHEVIGVGVKGCLHLKSAVTQVGENTVLLNPDCVNHTIYSAFKIIETHPDEPAAANALLIDDTVVFPADYPKTALRLMEEGIDVLLVDNSEVIKAEGGVTCCSIVL